MSHLDLKSVLVGVVLGGIVVPRLMAMVIARTSK